jgi:demethylmenaquinone methyltransferase/2-methoxy-6-polyprenyl-1,4-benzoquinol methylase
MKKTHESSTVSFGFEEVSPQEKTARVRGVFSRVASRYDLMNDLMSGMLHRVWKNLFITKLNPKPNTHLLDVAGGTGDITFRFLEKCPTGQVTTFDLNQDMLDEGRNRAIDRNYLNNIEWICGNAQDLPFPDNHFDYYTIAFGIRNVTFIDQALKEAYRVLKPGGRFMCLEFSHVTLPLLAKIYDAYSFSVIPTLGKLVANDRESYQYLVESIRRFPKQEEFLAMMTEAGFVQASYENLTQGVVAVHSGWKV